MLFYDSARLLMLLLLFQVSLADLRVLINYRDDGFITEALDLAVDNQLAANITKRNLLAIVIRDESILERLQKNERVLSIEEDNIVESLGIFGSLELNNITGGELTPYGISMVQADQLWDIPEVDESFRVCVVDTGYNLGHPDLPTARDDEVTGTSTGSGAWLTDGNGHGTHCSGTIGAVGDNGQGVVGIRKNPNLFRFHIGKGLSNEGSGYESDIIEAVQGCVDNGAGVVSMSLGGSGKSKSSRNFYEDIYKEGILIIAAAGNEGNTGYAYPAAYEHVMSVAAVDRNETRPDFSQCNDQVEISAPGVTILSTFPPRTYAFLSGTSMACPHVAGVAAEVWSRFPACTNTQIRNVLLRSAKPIGEFGCYNGLGSGLVQAKAAFDMLDADGCAAGGSNDDAVGGCEQNPDFVKADNPYFGDCPSSAYFDGLSGKVYGALALLQFWLLF